MGDTLISGSTGNLLPGWTRATGDSRKTLFEPPDPDWCIFGSPSDVSEIALGACDGSSITTYDTESAAPLLTITPDQGWTFADVWYAPDGRLH